MKIYSKFKIRVWGILMVFIPALISCEADFLEEIPLSDLSTEGVLKTEAGFQNYLVALSVAARNEHSMDDKTYSMMNWVGTDQVSSAGIQHKFFKNYETYLTPDLNWNENLWNWAYSEMIMRANTIISNARKKESSDIWDSEAEKNAVIAEACFYRAYTYNLMANMWGGVPIADEVYKEPKVDFERATRQEVYEFARQDLEFASEWLPETTEQEGRIVKAAADHLLSEVYISLGKYDNAIESASDVINSGLYQIMTTRFGSEADQPGDVFSDLFREDNQNRSSGNLESIYVWQFEEYTLGGAPNRDQRHWIPFLEQITDPDGYGFISSDSIGRGVGLCRGSNYVLYDIWKDNWNDMRNSIYNMRRKFYYNNPESQYYGQEIPKGTEAEDTLRKMYPYSRKVEHKGWEDGSSYQFTDKDKIVFRLAETYLLRAEAYYRKEMLSEAASDINVLRNRANATPVDPARVDLDYILDERSRELYTEEARGRTLRRMGKLVERVRKYNLLESTRNSIQDYHELWPIPQSAIDANYGNKLAPNPGYN